jgi:hypothetical protein
MHNPADDTAIVHALLASNLLWQVRLYALPLLVVEPEQIPAHEFPARPKTNQYRIVRAKELMSSDPSITVVIFV